MESLSKVFGAHTGIRTRNVEFPASSVPSPATSLKAVTDAKPVTEVVQISESTISSMEWV